MLIKNKVKVGRNFFYLWLALWNAIFLTACGEAPPTPVSVPLASTPEPTLTPIPASTTTPTTIPTTQPTVAPTLPPTDTPRPTAQISFVWDTGGVRPSDADDVAIIVAEVTREEGLLSGYGNEQGITLQYDPTLITVEEIQEILERIGHPVTVRQ
jgi:hypothetical protein